MNTAVIDFETRSSVDLKKAGAWAYAEGEDTDIQCLVADLDGVVQLWVPARYLRRLPKDLARMFGPTLPQKIIGSRRIVAHNAEFEAALWTRVGCGKYDWPELPYTSMDCTAARAAACGLPRDLAGAGREAGLPVLKDPGGCQVMMRMCKPRRDGSWDEDPADVEALIRYCIQDVAAEKALDKVLPSLCAFEQGLWMQDQAINRRGVPVDVSACREIAKEIEVGTTRLLEEFAQLTGGRVLSPRQIAATLELLDQEEGVLLKSLTKSAVKGVLAGDVSDRARRILEIRAILGKASTAKYLAFLRMACRDGRIRGSLMYHGAATGRWSGKGIQPQNMARGTFSDTEACVKAFLTGGWDLVETLWGNAVEAASTCVRSMIRAEDGKELAAVDFKAIEGRVLAWEARDSAVLEDYRTGDPYKTAASWIYGVPVSEVTKAQRQIGKVAELALGYQGGQHALETMADNYGVKIPEEERVRIVEAWRSRRPITVQYWADVQNAFLSALRNPTHVYPVGKVTFCALRTGVGPQMVCTLPSGRRMCYHRPHMSIRPGEERESLAYWGVDSKTKKWAEIWTYGGKLVENITQAIARDALAEVMMGVANHGLCVVLHVHDELVVESCHGKEALQALTEIGRRSPRWAPDLPMAVEGWHGVTYRK